MHASCSLQSCVVLPHGLDQVDCIDSVMSVVQQGKIHPLIYSKAADSIEPAHAPSLGTKFVPAATLHARWC